jgi:hypothetical protein
MMKCTFLTWLFDGAWGADQSALAAINRALLVSWLCRESSLSRRGVGQAIPHVPIHVLTRMLVPLKAGGINLLIFHGVYPCYNLNVGRCIY